MKPVEIHVRGGVAFIGTKPKGVQVKIINWDEVCDGATLAEATLLTDPETFY